MPLAHIHCLLPSFFLYADCCLFVYKTQTDATHASARRPLRHCGISFVCSYIGPSTVFGSSSKLANVEQWRCVMILRNHTGGEGETLLMEMLDIVFSFGIVWSTCGVLYKSDSDVMDVAWSPHDVWLASCSVDNTIVIWNARKFPGEKSI